MKTLFQWLCRGSQQSAAAAFFFAFFYLLGLLMGLIDSCTFKGKKKVKSLLRVFLLSCEIRESIILDSKKYYLKLIPSPL